MSDTLEEAQAEAGTELSDRARSGKPQSPERASALDPARSSHWKPPFKGFVV